MRDHLKHHLNAIDANTPSSAPQHKYMHLCLLLRMLALASSSATFDQILGCSLEQLTAIH
jgi:hypothetical protein